MYLKICIGDYKLNQGKERMLNFVNNHLDCIKEYHMWDVSTLLVS